MSLHNLSGISSQIMNLFKRPPFSNELTKLLTAQPDTTLLTVLTNKGLAAAARSEADELINYFIPANATPETPCPHLSEILDVVMDGTLNGEAVDYTIQTNAINLLATPSGGTYKKFTQRLMNSNIFQERIKTFMTGPHAQDCRYAGYFSRLCGSCITPSKGAFLETPNFYDFLVDNVHISAYMILLQSILYSYSTGERLRSISDRIALADEKAAEYITCLTLLGNDLGDYSSMADEHIVRNFFTAFLKLAPRSRAAFLGWRFVYQLKASTTEMWVETVLDEISPQFLAAPNADTLASGLGVFGKRWMRGEVVDKFFSLNSVDTFMCQSFLDAIDDMTDDELAQFVSEQRIIERLVECEEVYFTSKKYKKATNGFIQRLAQKLLSRELPFNSPAFDRLVTAHTMRYERFVSEIQAKYASENEP